MAERLTHTISETAERLGVSQSFLYLEIGRGKLATLKFGKRRLVHVEDEAAYLARHRQTAEAA